MAAIYLPPLFLGINPGILFINNLIWWPTLQTLLGFYIARRIVGNVDRSKPLLSKGGIIFFFSMFILVSASFRLFVPFPITPQQLIVLGFVIGTGLYFRKLVKSKDETKLPEMQKNDIVLDLIAIFTLCFIIFSIFYFTKDPGLLHVTLINQDALKANIIVAPLVALALLIRRITSKKPIQV